MIVSGILLLASVTVLFVLAVAGIGLVEAALGDAPAPVVSEEDGA